MPSRLSSPRPLEASSMASASTTRSKAKARNTFASTPTTTRSGIVSSPSPKTFRPTSAYALQAHASGRARRCGGRATASGRHFQTPAPSRPSDTTRSPRSERSGSHVKAEVHDVSVAHHVLLAFDPQLPEVAALGLAAEAHVVLPPDDLGLNEALLEVRVDDSRGLRRFGSSTRRPRAHLGLARREEREQIELRIAGAYHAVESRLEKSRPREELGAVLRVELGDLRLERRAHRDDWRPFGFGEGFECAVVRIGLEVGDGPLVDVGDVKRGLGGQELHLAQDACRLVVVRQREGARRAARIEVAGERLAHLGRELLEREV